MRYDTIVIGAGLAGLMAAIGRAEQGQRVLLVAKGQGTTHWAGGWIDLLDTPLPDQSLAAVLDQLIAANPAHPYALVRRAGIEKALNRLQVLCEEAGYPLAGSLERNVVVPTAVGALRPTCLLPLTMVAGDIRQWGTAGVSNGSGERRPILVAGFHELRDFFPPLIAANLREQGYPAEGVYLDLPPLRRRLDFTTAVFARPFDEPEFRAHVGRQLRRYVREGGYERIALPAVLGLFHPCEVIADLQAASGALIFEIATLPASVPGIRLYRLLQHHFEKLGGRVQLGSRVVRSEGADGRLEAIYTEAAAREQRHRAERFVLATGGIAGGGVRAEPNGELHETALGLPLRGPDGNGAWFEPRFLNERGHPVFRSGIAVDVQFRPLDAAGRVVYENVAVAGSALAGVDAIHEGCLEGLAVATGWAVGNQ